MDIKNIIGELNPYNNQKVQDRQRTESTQRTAKSESEGSDVVNLSGDGKLLATAMTTAKDTPDVRAEKVRELKEQVKNGTYKPDIQKAARNLIRDDLSRII